MGAGLLATAFVNLGVMTTPPALAGAGEKPPPVIDMAGGCTLDALDLFSSVRAKFSLEVGKGQGGGGGAADDARREHRLLLVHSLARLRAFDAWRRV